MILLVKEHIAMAYVNETDRVMITFAFDFDFVFKFSDDISKMMCRVLRGFAMKVYTSTVHLPA